MLRNPVTAQIPDSLPDYTQPVFTPKEEDPDLHFVNTDEDWYDEPDYTQAVAKGMQDVLNERPQLTRSEAE